MSSFHRGFSILAIGTLLGKFVALAREIIFASAFGTGVIATGFRVAQTASIAPATLISGDLLSAAFAPSYARAAKSDPEEASALLWAYSTWLTVVLCPLAAGVFAVRSLLVGTIIPGAPLETVVQATEFLGLLCWAIPLFGLSGIFAYALGVHGIYAATSIRPLIQSVGLIIGTTLAIWTGWIQWLALGFIAAWLLYSIICGWLAVRQGLFRQTTVFSLWQGWRFILIGCRQVAPLLVLPIAIQYSIVLERSFASLGPDGLIAAVDYARAISDSVMSLIAVPLGILGLTQLSALNQLEYQSAVRRMNNFVIALMLPVSSILCISASSLVQILFVRGAFGEEAAHLTSTVLIGISAGIAFQVAGYALSRALTAIGRNRAVMGWTIGALAGQVAVQSFGMVFIGPLAIGLGPSIFGVILTVGCAVTLQLTRPIGIQLRCALPSMIATIFLLSSTLTTVAQVALALITWFLNCLIAGPLRRPLSEQILLILRFLANRIRKVKN